MNIFLSKISQLDTICDVILLSTRGELLFLYQEENTPLSPHKNIAGWNDLITSFARPQTAEFIFARGRYYLQLTDLGYLIFGMRDESHLNKLKIACKNVRIKLSDRQTRKRTLLKMLTEADELLKPHIIKELMSLADREVGQALIALLQQHAHFQSKSKERLLLIICQALGYCANRDEAISALNTFIATATTGPTGHCRLHPDIEIAARMTIQQLEQNTPAPVQPLQQSRRPPPPPSPESPPPPDRLTTAGCPVADLPESGQIAALLQQNSKAEAITMILKAITVYARSRQFTVAEQLREWLIEIDSMAIGEIIGAAEIIEEEKKALITQEHLRVWKKLIAAISVEAFSALYHACTTRRYAHGESVLLQGDFSSTLFLVNRGKVQLHALCQDRNESLKVVGQGEIFGADTFFEASVSTVGARSLDAEVLLLPLASFLKIKESHPALEARLLAFCRQLQVPRTHFSRSQKSRRRHERKPAACRAALILLDDRGKDTATGARGDLLDVSMGGASLSLHSSQKKNADALLGNTVRIAIYCGLIKTPLTRISVVRAVQGYDPIGNLYALHLEFEQELTSRELQQIVTLKK